MKTVSFTDPYAQEQMEIDRRRKLAEALQAQGAQGLGPTETVGGWAIKRSPLEGLGSVAKSAAGAYRSSQVDEEQKALGERARGDRTSDMQALMQALQGAPAQPGSASPADELGGGPAAPATEARAAGRVPPELVAALKTPQMQDAAMAMWQQQMAKDVAPPERVDLGDRIGLVKNGQLVGSLPKSATPDAVLKEGGSDRRHATASGSAQLGAQTTLQTHATPSGGALLTDARTRSEGALGRGVTLRGQDLTDARARETTERDKFGAPVEVTGPNGPMLVMQNKGSGALVDANTRQPVPQVGPKVGESAQKQQTGVATTKEAITEYRDALKKFSGTDLVNPAARARMGTVYNNMLLQAKEAYNLGVLNGPDYMILQEVITNPASWTGAVTSKSALDDQAKKLDEIMGKVGATVTRTQSGQTQNRRATDADNDPLGLRKK